MSILFLVLVQPKREISLHSSVVSTPKAFRLLTNSLPRGYVGQSYTIAFAYRGGTAPVKWKIHWVEDYNFISPRGMDINDELGTIEGMPNFDGIFRVAVNATDASGSTSSSAYDVNITREANSYSPVIVELLPSILFVAGIIGMAAIILLPQRRGLSQKQAANDTTPQD